MKIPLVIERRVGVGWTAAQPTAELLQGTRSRAAVLPALVSKLGLQSHKEGISRGNGGHFQALFSLVQPPKRPLAMPRRYLRTARGAPTDLTGKRLTLALEEELERPSECKVLYDGLKEGEGEGEGRINWAVGGVLDSSHCLRERLKWQFPPSNCTLIAFFAPSSCEAC